MLSSCSSIEYLINLFQRFVDIRNSDHNARISAMNQVAFVISASNKDYEDVDITEVIQELAKRDIAADIVAFDDDSSDPDWGKYDLILPTPSLDYTHQYERLLQVRIISFPPNKCRLYSPPSG